MKKLSIKMRVTLWYSLLMLLLAALVLGFMVLVSGYVAESGARDALVRVVEANMDEVEYDDGEIDIDDDFAYFKNGVSSVVYSADSKLAGGHITSGFASDEPLIDGKVRTVGSDGVQYYIYDRLITFGKHDDLWIRGIIPIDGSTGVIGTVLKAAFILLPFIVLFAALMGFQITRNAFKPVDKIARAANAISEGSDLSKRIELGEGRDEIHRLAETFDHMFSRLETSFEEEKQFTSDVSHELRTPVSVILSQCEYALEHASAEEEYRESIETVKRQASRMSRLISQLLTFSRLEQGVEKAAFEEINLSELVTMICEEQTMIGGKGITLSMEIEDGIYAVVDRSLMARMMSNLIDNAYKYGKKGGKVCVRMYRDKDEVLLSVTDDGIGISPEHLEKIWRRFYQVDQSRTDIDNGSMGLGLAMVRQIVKMHGGRTETRSVPGEGSTFAFRFPIKN